jgi:translation initiation factor IF-2
MSDTNDTKKPAAGGHKTLTLKKTETSTVKQSFSHGRTKAVVVEKKRTRVEPGAKPAAPAKETQSKAAPATPAPAAPAAPGQSRPGVVLRQLTEEEKARRGAALADARVHEEEARRLAEDEARRRAEEESRLKQERDAAAKRKAEEEARKAAEEAAKKRAEEEAHRRLEKKDEPAPSSPAAKAPAAAPLKPAAEAPRRKLVAEEEEESAPTPGGVKAPVKTPAVKKSNDGDRRRGKLTVTKALSGDDERMRSVASYKRHRSA